MIKIIFIAFVLVALLSPKMSFAAGIPRPVPLPGTNEPNDVDLGRIEPPAGTVPNVGEDPSGFIASLVRAGLTLFIIVAFVIDLIWTIIAGIRFILAGGDEKAVAAAWSQIYLGLLGMAVVLGSFAIIKMVEVFFNVSIISAPFKLPRI